MKNLLRQIESKNSSSIVFRLNSNSEIKSERRNIENQKINFIISHYFITLNCQNNDVTRNKTLSKNREEFDFKNVILTLDLRDCSKS